MYSFRYLFIQKTITDFLLSTFTYAHFKIKGSMLFLCFLVKLSFMSFYLLNFSSHISHSFGSWVLVQYLNIFYNTNTFFFVISGFSLFWNWSPNHHNISYLSCPFFDILPCALEVSWMFWIMHYIKLNYILNILCSCVSYVWFGSQRNIYTFPTLTIFQELTYHH